MIVIKEFKVCEHPIFILVESFFKALTREWLWDENV